MNDIVYLNGEFLPAAQAKISVYDGAFLHGAGLFETMRADYGSVFRLDAHIDRLLSSAEKLGLPVERPDLPLAREFTELLKRNNLQCARLRMTVSVGSMYPTAVQPISSALTVCVTACELIPQPEELIANGMSVMISPFTQSTTDPLAGHKTIDYLPRLLALRQAQKFKCAEALWFTPQNYLAEGCISSVFVVKSGILATPPLSTPVLPGVSRAVVLEIAKEDGITAEEKMLNINDLLDADEVFITNSSMQVMPVCRVEKKTIASGKPGDLTKRLRRLFVSVVERECKS